MVIEKLTNKYKDTYEYAHNLAKYLKKSDIIFLTGDLGAGKTLFARGLCKGLGVQEEITSPTFNLLNVYQNTDKDLIVYHFDLYRLNRAEELEDIGFNEYVYSTGISMIEWADKFPEYLPDEYLLIEIEKTGENDRIIKLSFYGDRYENLGKEIDF